MDHEKRLREIESELESSRRDLDEALEAAGISIDDFRRLAAATPASPAARRLYDDLTGGDDVPARPSGATRFGIRI